MDTPITISDKKKPARQTNHLTIGALIFPRMDQIDFTGPFEVLSRIPDSTIHVIAKTKSQVRDITTGLHRFDRASSWMATWSPLPALPQDSMPRWLSLR